MSKLAPLITVIMPVHNGAQYLEEAIDSVLAQSFTDFELLIINDHSTDESVDIISGYKDHRIRLINAPERLKLAGALNLGMREAQGEFLARMDADDISLPKRLQTQLQFLQNHAELGLCGTWISYFPEKYKKIEQYPLSREEVYAFSLFHSPFAHPTVMMRRSWFTRYNLWYDVTYYPTEDFDLWSRALQHFPGANIPEVLLQYRIHPSSLTRADWSTMDEQAAAIIRRGLEALGLKADMVHARQHRTIAMVQIERTSQALADARTWLAQIIKSNAQKNVYPQQVLKKVTEDLWFRLCMRYAGSEPSAPLHFLCHRFYSSPILLSKRLAILCASAFKHRIEKRGA
ncbi:glycosyltransferase family 2 protein [Desulfobulbus alkaliphilus]|uniref:glycosyltransferase family 2 protein n=1 Tax=Desulfobulbus alkaliphilus TaxID=869814 RepID=UPI0019648A5C|nr:glycosyltransferase [Desulfobulbus alkaliphilus]MBM9538196.1 glycosyltransferase [Desulfobulbus alkaliphilus]